MLTTISLFLEDYATEQGHTLALLRTDDRLGKLKGFKTLEKLKDELNSAQEVVPKLWKRAEDLWKADANQIAEDEKELENQQRELEERKSNCYVDREFQSKGIRAIEDMNRQIEATQNMNAVATATTHAAPFACLPPPQGILSPIQESVGHHQGPATHLQYTASSAWVKPTKK